MPQYPPKDLNEGKVARYSYKEGIIPGEPEVIIISSNQVITLTCQIIEQQILLILGGKITYTTLLRPTRLLISEIFPSELDFHLYK